MDWLYRIFYTVFSLGILMALLLPFVAAVRFLLRNFRKKYTVWIWWVFLLRSICPVSLSSALCIIPSWNRLYHRILNQMGLTIRDGKGIMRSWIAVFKNEITAADTFMICSIIWVAGVAGILLFALINASRVKKDLQSAKMLGEGIYETNQAAVPIQLGFFRRKLYVPDGFLAKEMKWILRHSEMHHMDGVARFFMLFVMAIHWFNPVMWLYYYWWNQDMEMAADDRTVKGEAVSERKAYAQGLINFLKDKKAVHGMAITSGPFFVGIREENIRKRAYRMMYQGGVRTSDTLFAFMVFSLAIVFCFLLRPMQIAWNGGTWGNGRQEKKEEALFQKKDDNVVTKMNAKSPEGLDIVIQLEMEDGEEGEQGYQGNFVLKMYDKMDNEITSRKVGNIFPDLEEGKQYFSKDVTLCISDYNGDGVQELVLGQKAEDASASEGGSETEYQTYSYVLLNIENKSFEVLCRDISAVGGAAALSESVPFEKPEGIDTIFMVPNKEETDYYVWNDIKKSYEKREMTEEDLKAYREKAEAGSSGEVQEHTLEDTAGNTVMLVSSKPDSTGSEVIQSVVLFPRENAKKFEDIQGYYCDLKWLSSEKEKNRYAQLIYNGTKSQTFIIYDTKRKTVYYRHEDGADMLGDVFKQYKETEITFNDTDAVIYELTGKKDDVLTIGFVASADGDITVKGSYTYDVLKKRTSNLAFSRPEGI